MNHTYICIGIFIITVIISLSCCGNEFKQGKKLYEQHCSSCHQTDGKGLAKLYPSLNGSDYWVANQGKISCIIKNGLQEPIVVNGQSFTTPMAGIKELTEFEIANIINYINHEWYPNLGNIPIKEIENSLSQCKENTFNLTK